MQRDRNFARLEVTEKDVKNDKTYRFTVIIFLTLRQAQGDYIILF